MKIVDVAAIHFQVSELHDEGIREAMRQFREASERLDGTGVDLVVTCEGMESISQQVEEAEEPQRPGPLLTAYGDFARRNRCTVAGSVKLRVDGNVYNALCFIGPDGECLGHYAKSFLTPGEFQKGLHTGPGARVTETPAGRLGGVICYDLNFDALADEYRRLRPDVLCFSSMFHGDHLQNSWAYRARAFFVGAVKDGISTIIDPLGRRVAESCYYNRIARARLNLDRFIMHQDRNMEKFPAIRAKYQKEVLIETNSLLGVSMLYSCSPERTAADIAREFGLVQPTPATAAYIDRMGTLAAFDRSRQIDAELVAA